MLLQCALGVVHQMQASTAEGAAHRGPSRGCCMSARGLEGSRLSQLSPIERHAVASASGYFGYVDATRRAQGGRLLSTARRLSGLLPASEFPPLPVTKWLVGSRLGSQDGGVAVLCGRSPDDRLLSMVLTAASRGVGYETSAAHSTTVDCWA